MDFNELIKTRESIRNYDPSRSVPGEVLGRILEAGRLSLSAANRQPWRFLVISSGEMLEKVGMCYHRDWFRDAPHIIVVVGLKDQAWKRTSDGYCSVETDTAIAMTHLILAAENEGVGACWIANFDPVKLRSALDLNDNEVIYGITPLGYPREGFRKTGVKNRRKPDEVIEYM